MKVKKTRNPLIKRIPKECKSDWRKYLVIFAFMVLMIGSISGLYVANDSMLKTLTTNFDKLKVEDGHFELKKEAAPNLLEELEENETVPVKIYEAFFREEVEDRGGKEEGHIRLYMPSKDVNLSDLCKGAYPSLANEIAIDRRHAENVGLKIGDKIKIGEKEFTITGLISYVNYTALYEKNTDTMFDALNFDVGMVTEEGFDSLNSRVHYSYAWTYKTKPASEKAEKKLSEDFLKEAAKIAYVNQIEVVDYLPNYLNQAIHFAPNDMSKDSNIGEIMLYILIAVIAFIFALTITSTIEKESTVIGTLRASGYTRGELTRHYLSMPVIITLISGLVGNVLGYTVFKNVFVEEYYNSYSMPTMKTVLNANAVLKTTFIPIAIMFIVNLIVIVKALKHTPQQFLRRDLKKRKKKKAMRLPRWSFMKRFRLRIICQNLPNYLVLTVGIIFVSIMMALCVGMPSTMKYYIKHAPDMMLAKYQYILLEDKDENGVTFATRTEGAEAFSMKEMEYQEDSVKEDVSVYGVAEKSQYVRLPESLKANEVYISGDFAKKWDLSEGDEFSLEEKYDDGSYQFKVKGVFEETTSIAIFMPESAYKKTFDVPEDSFTGFFSNVEIEDIDEEAIATVISVKDITRMADQMDHSMGSMMDVFTYVCVVLAAILIYLLTKVIVEKNEKSISMVKILGYKSGEIAGLYILSTTIVVVIAAGIATFAGAGFMAWFWNLMMKSFAGYFAFHFTELDYLKMFCFIILGYLLVMAFDYRRIRRIPMDEALKNIE